LFEDHLPLLSKTDSLFQPTKDSKMFYKEIPLSTSSNEIELQTISSRYGFSPAIISVNSIDNKTLVCMEDIAAECLADVYGEDPHSVPNWIWNEIRAMITTLYEHEGIEYTDITPYNFIEKDNRVYIIDFGDARYSQNHVPMNWFLEEFIDGENSWNPDYK